MIIADLFARRDGLFEKQKRAKSELESVNREIEENEERLIKALGSDKVCYGNVVYKANGRFIEIVEVFPKDILNRVVK